MMRLSLRRSSIALALAATMSLATAGATRGPTAAHADTPLGTPIGTLPLNCGNGQNASATATIADGELADADFRFSYSTTSGTTGYTDMPVGVILSPAKTTNFVVTVQGVARAQYTSVTLYAVIAVNVTLSNAACP